MSHSRVMEDRAEGVTIIYSKGGHVQSRLFTKEFIRNESVKPSYVDMKKGLKVEFYDDSLHIKNTLTARTGRWYDDEGNIILRDSVVIINDKGDELRTSELVWNEKQQIFFTEKKVHVVTATQIITGIGMESSQDFSWYRIKDILGSIAVDRGKVPQ